MRIELRGTEVATIEVTGSLPAEPARVLAGGTSIELDMDDDGGVRVSLLLFHMRGLAPWGLSGVGIDYREALWRVGVLHRSRPSWLVVRCDVDHAVVRASGARLLRYPMRPATLSLEHDDPAW